MESLVIGRELLACFVNGTPESEPYVLLDIPGFRMAFARSEAMSAVMSEDNGELIQMWGTPAEGSYGIVVQWSVLANS